MHSGTLEHERSTNKYTKQKKLFVGMCVCVEVCVHTRGNEEIKNDGIVERSSKCDGNARGAREGRGGAEISQTTF